MKKAKESTTASMGLRITGAKFRKSVDEPWQRVGKKEGKTLDKDAVVSAINRFFHSSSLRRQAHYGVHRLLRWFEHQRDFAFYASSLLFIYDTQAEQGGELHIGMIDFAHVETSPADGDQSYITGLQSLQDILLTALRGEAQSHCHVASVPARETS